MVDMLLDAASYSLSFSASSQRLVFARLDSHPDFFLCLLSSPCRFPLSAGSSYSSKREPVALASCHLLPSCSFSSCSWLLVIASLTRSPCCRQGFGGSGRRICLLIYIYGNRLPCDLPKLRVDWTTLRDTRVSKASDWVSQSSSTEVKAEILDCQLLYSCQVCHLLPARAASWYLLESPHTSRHSWVCARCGHKWGGCASQRKGRMWPASWSPESHRLRTFWQSSESWEEGQKHGWKLTRPCSSRRPRLTTRSAFTLPSCFVSMKLCLCEGQGKCFRLWKCLPSSPELISELCNRSSTLLRPPWTWKWPASRRCGQGEEEGLNALVHDSSAECCAEALQR